jgi:hypothetical protein
LTNSRLSELLHYPFLKQYMLDIVMSAFLVGGKFPDVNGWMEIGKNGEQTNTISMYKDPALTPDGFVVFAQARDIHTKHIKRTGFVEVVCKDLILNQLLYRNEEIFLLTADSESGIELTKSSESRLGLGVVHNSAWHLLAKKYCKPIPRLNSQRVDFDRNGKKFRSLISWYPSHESTPLVFVQTYRISSPNIETNQTIELNCSSLDQSRVLLSITKIRRSGEVERIAMFQNSPTFIEQFQEYSQYACSHK